MSSVYFLQLKPQTFEAFEKFKVFVEKQRGRFIIVLRMEKGGQFVSRIYIFLGNMVFTKN